LIHRIVSCWKGPPKLLVSLVVWEKRYVKLEVKDTRPRMCKRRLEIFWDFKEAIRLRYEGAKQSWERGF
jgi:hypothetical protein